MRVGFPLGQIALSGVTYTTIGDHSLLSSSRLGLFCSRKCPGELILKSYDMMQNLRESGVTVISGFHAPMDRECLRILLRGKQPIVVCPARSIETMRIRAEYREPLEQGRLLFLSPFAARETRISADRSEARNRFVASLADAILFVHAANGSKTEALCRAVLAKGKPTYCIESRYNEHLVAIGVRPVPLSFDAWFA
jgi:predicted Rossmann fold nucleotide-binding protein DprA/Smf involved in DNA uptake